MNVALKHPRVALESRGSLFLGVFLLRSRSPCSRGVASELASELARPLDRFCTLINIFPTEIFIIIC